MKVLRLLGLLGLLGLVFAGSLLAQVPKTAVLGSAQYLTYVGPVFTATSYTQEFRALGLTTPGGNKYLVSDTAVGCYLTAAFNLVCIDGPASTIVTMPLGSRTDIRVRIVRDVVLHTFRVEIWDGNGTNYATDVFSTVTVSDNRTAGTGGFFYDGAGASGGGSIAFWREYSHATPAGSAPPSESPTLPGDKGDFQFEGSLADVGAAGLVLSLHGGGSVSYVDSPVFPPVSSITEDGFPVRSLAAKLLTSSSFSSLLGNGQPSLFWAQVSGPSQGTFSSSTAQSTTFSAPVAGTYGIRLIAKDALGAYTPVDIKVGVVATDINGVVDTGLDPVRDRIIGPQLMSGLSPWPYADHVMKAAAKELKDVMLAYPPSLAISTGTLLTGTCTLTTSPAVCTRVGGTSWISQGVAAGKTVLILWDTIDGPGTGRLIDVVYDCTGSCPVTSTTFRITTNDIQVATGSGYSVYLVGPDISTTLNGSPGTLLWATYLYQSSEPGSNYRPYYDFPMAARREKYRNGLDEYLADSNVLLQQGWDWGSDHARYGGAPRGKNFDSQYLAAMDNPGRFPELYGLVLYYNASLTYQVNLANCPNCDDREPGILTRAQALGAMTDPDSTRHTAYCGMLDTSAASWIANMNVLGYWAQRPQSFNYAPTYGESPWKTAAWAIYSLELAHDALKDYCGNTSRATSLLPVIRTATDFVYLYGRNSTRDGYFDVLYPNNGQDNLSVSGTVSVSTSVNPTKVVGSGTAFLTDFASLPAYITIPDGGGNNYAHLVSAVTNNTDLTMATAWGSQAGEVNRSGVTAHRTTVAQSSCGNSASNCNGPDRNFVVQMAGIHGWIFRQTGLQVYKTRGDEVYSASFGGPADGPGGSAAPGGPGADGILTFVSDGMYNCPNLASASSKRCSNNGTAIGPFHGNAYKDFSEGFGVGCSQCYLADRLGGIQAHDYRAITRDINLASVPTASKHRVTALLPNGNTVTNTCSAGRCSVTVDARMGSVGLVKSEYLDSSNKVLAATDFESLGLASLQ